MFRQLGGQKWAKCCKRNCECLPQINQILKKIFEFVIFELHFEPQQPGIDEEWSQIKMFVINIDWQQSRGMI